MDREARKRGVSVYLVEKRIDMLPELLGPSNFLPFFPFDFDNDGCASTSSHFSFFKLKDLNTHTN